MTTRWYLGLILALIAVLLFALTSSMRTHLQAERALLLAQFAAVGIDPTASSTAALRLEWFVDANRIDPIFALPGTDPGALRESLTLLRGREREMLTAFPRTDRALLAHALYPWNFLSQLPDTEAARVSLLSNPSYMGAVRYTLSLHKLIDGYGRDSAALTKALAISTSSNSTYVFLGEAASRDSFDSALRTLAAQATAKQVTAMRRLSCLFVFNQHCDTLASLLSARATSIEVPAAMPPPSAKNSTTRDLLATIHTQMFPPRATDQKEPPLIAMHTNCFPYPTTYMYLWWQALPGSGDARKSSITNDVYLDIVRPQQNPVYAGLYSEGIRLKYQISGHYYLCADSGIDVMREAAALSVDDTIKAGPIVTGKSELAREEAHIRASDYIDTHDIGRYVADAAALIAQEGYAPLRAEFGVTAVDRLDQIIGLWQSGSLHFDETIREAANDNDYLARFDQTVPLFPTLLSRSFASLLYLDGNATVADGEVSFAYATTSYPLANFRMTSWNALLAAGSSSPAILDEVLREIPLQQPYIRK